MTDIIELNLKDIIDEIRTNLKQAKWDKAKTQKYLLVTYGKDGLLKLNDEQLLEFARYTSQIKDNKVGAIKKLSLRKLQLSNRIKNGRIIQTK